ncbi:MAG: SPOR domain-containing protein [Magnetococcales bacterium]|nr:SPOR domain-containing protein [Magnetococcales bacterium]
MKTSSSREQQLFLITGGAILFLILAVVVFNMISTPSPVSEVATLPASKVQSAENKVAEVAKGSSNDAWKINLGAAKETPPASQDLANTVLLAPKEVVPPVTESAESGADPLGKARQMLESAPGGAKAGQGNAAKSHAASPNSGSAAAAGATVWNRDPGTLESARKEMEAASTPEQSAHSPTIKPVAKQTPPPVKVAKVPEKMDRAEKPEKTEKPEKLEKPEKIEKPERTATPPEPPKPVQAVKPAQAPKPVQPAKPVQAAKADYSEALTQVIAKQYDTNATDDDEEESTPAPAVKKAAPAKPAAASASGSSYQIQIGSFATADKAQALVERIAAVTYQGRRIPVNQSNATVNGKTYFRVRAGPFSSRDSAQAALHALSQKGVSGSIVGQD